MAHLSCVLPSYSCWHIICKIIAQIEKTWLTAETTWG